MKLRSTLTAAGVALLPACGGGGQPVEVAWEACRTAIASSLYLPETAEFTDLDEVLVNEGYADSLYTFESGVEALTLDGQVRVAFFSCDAYWTGEGSRMDAEGWSASVGPPMYPQRRRERR